MGALREGRRHRESRACGPTIVKVCQPRGTPRCPLLHLRTPPSGPHFSLAPPPHPPTLLADA